MPRIEPFMALKDTRVLRLMGFLGAFALAWSAGAADAILPAAAPSEPLWDSFSSTWTGETLATKEWTDERGQLQRLELLRRGADGVLFYRLHAILAVCGDAGKESSCKLHEFSACFDEMGQFLGYRVDADHFFTRAKHEPFRPEDYQALDAILRDPDHVLCTIKDDAGGVDATSGATVQYVAEHAVAGAYYTCKAIWSLAQRTGPERAQAWTLERTAASDVGAWQARKESLKLWWFLDHLEKSSLPVPEKVDLTYHLLAFPQPEVQDAALRYLERSNAPFLPDRAGSKAYPQLDDTVKPHFLAWWQARKHDPPALVDAVLADLNERAVQYSPVTGAALDYLSALKLTGEERCRAVLKILSVENPSTYIRNRAARLLGKR